MNDIKPERYAVVGASQGTGLLIAQALAAAGKSVRAISRRPPPPSQFVEPFSADVTSQEAISEALNEEFKAVFFTVDKTGGIGGHALFGSKADIRAVSYQGCVNTIDAVKKAPGSPRFVLLSVIGHEQGSMIWSILNFVKPGLRANVSDREKDLVDSGLPYVVLRAPKLTDNEGGQTALGATSESLKLTGGMELARADLAKLMIQAAERAPENTIWDLVSGPEASAPEWLTE